MSTPISDPPTPDDEVLADLRAALLEDERGESIVLTQEQLAQWAATGEWPRELLDSSD